MKRLISMLAIMSLIISVTFAFAEEKKSDPALSVKSASVLPCKQASKEIMTKCPMMKQNKDIKIILKQILDLQQRSLAASSKEKTKIKKEIADLIIKIDAMPDKMDCPMMNMKHDVSDKKGSSEEQAKDQAKPSEHKH